VFEPDEEADAVLALRVAFPNHQLRIDPNSNWSMATSLRIAEKLDGVLEYYEDPTPTLEGMAELHRATNLPLATNMVVTNWAELKRAIELNSVQILLSDHHFWGGLRATQALARTCQTYRQAIDDAVAGRPLDPRLVGGCGRAADKQFIVFDHRLFDLGREDDRRLLPAFDDLIAAEQSHARDQKSKERIAHGFADPAAHGAQCLAGRCPRAVAVDPHTLCPARHGPNSRRKRFALPTSNDAYVG